MNSNDYHNTITKLRQVVNTVKIFTDVDECIDFITDMKEEKISMIISSALDQIVIPITHDIPQINTIYIFCGNEIRHEQWFKVKVFFVDITPICDALKQVTQDCDKNLMSISFVAPNDEATNQNLDQLDQSFMYSQIPKEILLTIDFEQQHMNEFLSYYREQCGDNTAELKNFDKFEKEYDQHQPTWWYTYSCFLYSMLNRALRTMEVGSIIRMAFFVRDLHNHIKVVKVCLNQTLINC